MLSCRGEDNTLHMLFNCSERKIYWGEGEVQVKKWLTVREERI
jgi:hypothetical protein